MSNHIKKELLNKFIRNREFSDLFVELSWDKENLDTAPLQLSLDEGRDFCIELVAEKRGFAVCVCNAGEEYPEQRSERRKLVNLLSRHHYEHLLIIHGKDRQCWTVAIRPQNRPMRTVEVEWRKGQDIQSLMEKLDGMIFDISEEDGLGITDVVDRVRGAFMQGAEKVTKKFYSQFKKELEAFSEFIEGIQEQVSKDWYAALMLNRLMFIYFIQKKRFLDGDIDYLENRLNQTKKEFGADKFHDQFYRHFLRRLFSEGLGMPESERKPELKNILGKIPYLNGGLFDIHEIEQENKNIQIPDEAFEKLFAFFGQYDWHLDTRPSASGKDINPDVIGYIFEKYINARARAAKGAYYTQEDITGYIARNAIIPFLLHRAEEKCKNAFDPQNGIWRFLRKKPDDYIYDAVKKGCDIPDQEIPANIRRGMGAKSPKLLERREDWNTKTEERFALPAEIWRETIARRERYFELKAKIENGEIHRIDDLITHNLDIERFTTDALRHYEGSDFIDVFYEAIAGRKSLRSNMQEKYGVAILDPACGSGAFLFAALNILEPLYERCVERMRDFVEDDDRARMQDARSGTKKHPQFRAVLEDIETHQNQKYWIYKTIILNNLYGVDMMKEATEIAKLRLFLKLAAEAEYDAGKSNLGLEPLPDIDFNIRSGNSLVGFANMAAFEKAVSTDATGQTRMDLSDGLIGEVREQAELVQKANNAFRRAQDVGGKGYRKAKVDLSERLTALNDKMNRYLAKQYGKNDNGKDYEQWLTTHQPFHWLAEFYGIIEESEGFDVVIGNPPYVEYNTIRENYTIKDFKTESSGNLYAYFLELGANIAGGAGNMGMIIPISFVSTPRTKAARTCVESRFSLLHISNFADRPGTLFNGVHQKTSILLTSNLSKGIFTTNFAHWSSRNERTNLFDKISYMSNQPDKDGTYLKIGSPIEKEIQKKLENNREGIFNLMSKKQTKNKPFYLNMRLMFWVKCFLDAQKSNEFKTYFPTSILTRKQIMAILNSSIFFWFWEIIGDCWHLTNRELQNFLVSKEGFSAKQKENLSLLSDELAKDLEKNKSFVGTVQTDYEYYHKKSKRIIDKIDITLSQHYSFTEEELDYIINYAIKYRMGIDK